MIRLLFLGDIVGEPGRAAAKVVVSEMLKAGEVDFVVVNGENAAQGKGISPKIAIDLVGSHDWAMADEVHERPESVAIRGEDARLVEEALATLPAEMQRVLWLRHWEGKPFATIATELGRSEMAIRRAWCRGFERLERAIRDRASPHLGPGSGA